MQLTFSVFGLLFGLALLHYISTLCMVEGWGRRELGLAWQHHHSVCPSYQNLFGVFPSPVTHLVTFNSNRAKQKKYQDVPFDTE